MMGSFMSERIPPLYALRAFEVAARSCSFTRAAEELSLTQSAISRHIRNLEELFGCHLFERKGPKLQLTDAGQGLAQELKAGFKLIEDACLPFRANAGHLRLKAPSSLTMRWLLQVLEKLNAADPGLAVQLSSVWMDIDSVDFYAEPYDCAILLGDGHFGAQTECCKLFDEWLIPICSSKALGAEAWTLETLEHHELIHPSSDRRDWRRWLRRLDLDERVRLDRGKVFGTLDQGISAAMRGHGVSIADLGLVLEDVRDGLLALPFKTAVGTGDSYYLVWLKGSLRKERILAFRDFLNSQLPQLMLPEIEFC